MTKLEEIEQAIQGLNRQELSALRRWFIAFDADAWDREIEEDARAGRLDALAREAAEDYKAGRSTEL
ncbi:MAG: hypothetical protein HYZ00_06570 [Candidatus Hydrogenedentes bacterium]|nr:hypothetical protein [Candidatus Hydrogenedentota bacterium]